MALKCRFCGKTYKTSTTFLRHKCAKKLRIAAEEAIEKDDLLEASQNPQDWANRVMDKEQHDT